MPSLGAGCPLRKAIAGGHQLAVVERNALEGFACVATRAGGQRTWLASHFPKNSAIFSPAWPIATTPSRWPWPLLILTCSSGVPSALILYAVRFTASG